MIPSSIYATDETPIKQRSLVAAAAATHQNTLRVWGGGRYVRIVITLSAFHPLQCLCIALYLLTILRSMRI